MPERSAVIDKSVRLPIMARDGGKCRCCGSRKRLELHHIVPRVDGGESTARNLITLCRACHDDVELGLIGWPDYGMGVREKAIRLNRKVNAGKSGRRVEMYRLDRGRFLFLGERYE